MPSATFGDLAQVGVRELWQHEARNFTPWLLQNKNYLERALGIDIELDDRKQSVGSFELDITGRNVFDNSALRVWNQLGSSDYRHHGQLLT